MCTKSHIAEESDSQDNDLLLFLDFDLAVLGSERNLYMKYASNIRKEYNHVAPASYCQGRSNFLRSLLSDSRNIYLTEKFRISCESQARDNILWECSLLESGIIPGETADP